VPVFRFDVPLDLVLPPALARLILSLARGPLRYLGHQRTLFIGNVAGEKGCLGLISGIDLGDVAGFVHREARALADRLGAPMLVWKDFPDSDRVAMDSLTTAGHVFRMPSYPGTRIDVARGGYGEFLSAARSDRRHKIRSKLRRGKAAVATRSSVEIRPNDASLDAMFALFEQTRARATTTFETLTPEFFRQIATSEVARFIVLRHASSDQILAFMLVLSLGRHAVNQFIGLDYACAEAGHLYFQVFETAYDWAAESGAEVLFSGQTGYMAKLDLGHRLIPLWNYCEHRSRIVNAAFRKGAKSIGWNTLDPQIAEYLRAHPDALPGE
jgi:hypothetical protein